MIRVSFAKMALRPCKNELERVTLGASVSMVRIYGPGTPGGGIGDALSAWSKCGCRSMLDGSFFLN